jgi:hydrogenase nickel incorporation protein HypB
MCTDCGCNHDQSRLVRIEQDILAHNNSLADSNRNFFNKIGILTLNLVSSPGAGKTTLLVKTIKDIKDDYRIAVIEGDQQTTLDAQRIQKTGVKAFQVNTGKGCHLDADMVAKAIPQVQNDLMGGGILFIENVGNLVCPASFDLGEADKVIILSVTEGDDKPLKYPDMFAAANLMIINKIDLLPYIQFDLELSIKYARRINPEIKIIKLSATSGEGMEEWYNFLRIRSKTN